MALFRDTPTPAGERAAPSATRPQTVHPPSVIGARSRVHGTITGTGPLTVRGEVEGKITLTDRLTLAPESRVEAEVEAGWVELRGRLRGTVRAHNQIRITPPGRLEGDAVSPRVQVDLGAVVRGGLLIRSATPRRSG